MATESNQATQMNTRVSETWKYSLPANHPQYPSTFAKSYPLSDVGSTSDSVGGQNLVKKESPLVARTDVGSNIHGSYEASGRRVSETSTKDEKILAQGELFERQLECVLYEAGQTNARERVVEGLEKERSAKDVIDEIEDSGSFSTNIADMVADATVRQRCLSPSRSTSESDGNKDRALLRRSNVRDLNTRYEGGNNFNERGKNPKENWHKDQEHQNVNIVRRRNISDNRSHERARKKRTGNTRHASSDSSDSSESECRSYSFERDRSNISRDVRVDSRGRRSISWDDRGRRTTSRDRLDRRSSSGNNRTRRSTSRYRGDRRCTSRDRRKRRGVDEYRGARRSTVEVRRGRRSTSSDSRGRRSASRNSNVRGNASRYSRVRRGATKDRKRKCTSSEDISSSADEGDRRSAIRSNRGRKSLDKDRRRQKSSSRDINKRRSKRRSYSSGTSDRSRSRSRA